MTSDLVLCQFEPNLPLRVASDASPYGIGAVMFRDGTERPVWLLFLVHCRKIKKDIHNDK